MKTEEATFEQVYSQHLRLEMWKFMGEIISSCPESGQSQGRVQKEPRRDVLHDRG